jgi:PAS domain S-box-containing protein
MSKPSASSDLTHGPVGVWESKDVPIDFRALSWRSSAGQWVFQEDRIVYANPMLARLLGRDLAEIVGQSPRAYVHPGDRDQFDEQLRRGLSGEGEAQAFETRLVRGDGEIVVVEVHESKLEHAGQPAVMGNNHRGHGP